MRLIESILSLIFSYSLIAKLTPHSIGWDPLYTVTVQYMCTTYMYMYTVHLVFTIKGHKRLALAVQATLHRHKVC